MAIRDLMKLPVLGLVALAAACGGGEGSDTAATTSESAPTTATEAPATPAPAPAPAPTAGTGTVHDVKMVTTQGGASGEFQPTQITVKRGDKIRWTMADGQAAHNVSFTLAQGNPAGFTPPADSPLYSAADQTYEIPADWAPGTYNYVCMPHAGMGMKGSITVTE
ncbi:MAG TPA: plastocyanin/azurin family copper-binding protein [Longimicrobium sp.]|uniref:plastocyanin/azurin family copper-binding protein n=1 Tax=Longimicrobium sp. TaxID=2029185 RepID=UPI002EDA21BE